MYVPPGFAVVTPYMTVSNAARLIDFLIHAFEAKEISRHLAPDGRIMNAEMEISGCRFMLGESSQSYEARPGSYYIYVENADASLQRAIAHGGQVIMPVEDKPYGDRQGGITDPVGNWWWISQRLVKEPYTP